MKKLLLLAAALCITAAPALARDRDRICIRQDDIRNWTAINDKKIVLENYRHQKALLKLIGTCSGFRYSEALAIRSPGASRLSCVEVGDTIITRTSGLEGRCAVVSVTRYTGPMTTHGRHNDDDGGDHGGDNNRGDHGGY